MKVINWTYVLVASIIGVSIVGYGGLTFYSKERDRQAEAIKLEEQKEAVKLRGQEDQIRRSNLQLCLDATNVEYNQIFRLNSDSVPTKDDPNVRRWKSAPLKESATKKLNDDREFCLKQYGK